MFRVWVEYRDSDEVEYYECVTKEYWFNHLYNRLENDDTVEHYVVETIED